jgi:23S rRNA (guanosine2251-2'-O)-methyltransferase
MQIDHDNKINDLIFGTRPVLEAFESHKEVNKVLVQKGQVNEHTKQIIYLARAAKVPVQFVPIEKLNRVTRKNHQGIIAFLSPITYDIIEEVVTDLFESGIMPTILVLDGVTDVRNFGSICRSAECLGAHAVVIPSQGGAMVNADAVKTSAGAIFNLKICRTADLLSSVKYLKNSGLSIVASSEKSSTPIHQADLNKPIALVLGAEDIGIDKSILALADQEVLIPMIGKTKSLNVAVSAAIVLYESSKQRLSIES